LPLLRQKFYEIVKSILLNGQNCRNELQKPSSCIASTYIYASPFQCKESLQKYKNIVTKGLKNKIRGFLENINKQPKN